MSAFVSSLNFYFSSGVHISDLSRLLRSTTEVEKSSKILVIWSFLTVLLAASTNLTYLISGVSPLMLFSTGGGVRGDSGGAAMVTDEPIT